MRRIHWTVLAAVAALVLAACAPGTERFADDQAGFFTGVWHGWIAPISIVWHFFNGDVRIYEVNNTGIAYDIGFYVAVISGFGSIGLSRSKARKKRRHTADR